MSNAQRSTAAPVTVIVTVELVSGAFAPFVSCMPVLLRRPGDEHDGRPSGELRQRWQLRAGTGCGRAGGVSVVVVHPAAAEGHFRLALPIGEGLVDRRERGRPLPGNRWRAGLRRPVPA